ncbi:MAG: glutamate--tRNA ligase [Hasllibacter sp.]
MVTTRFAPSPTGFLHVGNLRAALFNWAIARRAGGTFVLRLDDTDPERSRPEYADAIREDLEWLGLTWDRLERQSDRLDRYAEAADRLRADGRLYEAFETPTELDLKRKKQLNMGQPPVYDRAALDLTEAERDALRAERPGHWRFKLDRERIEWADGILGEVSIDAASVSDPVLIRGDGQVLYTLASVVDDVEMGITDVVRGSDHVTNTATQIQMIRALGAEPPRFAHHSLLTGPGGEALSKRLGTLALRDLRVAGVEPMAVLSLMARLGSADPVELRETPEEIAEAFDLSRFGAAPTKLDPDDLKPLSARVVQGLPAAAVAPQMEAAGVPEAEREAFWAVIRENVETRGDLAGWWDLVTRGAPPLVAPEDAEFVARALPLLGDPPYGPETWGEWTAAVKEATGRKGRGLFLPLRHAVTGRERGPDMAALMPLLKVRPGG